MGFAGSSSTSQSWRRSHTATGRSGNVKQQRMQPFSSICRVGMQTKGFATKFQINTREFEARAGVSVQINAGIAHLWDPDWIEARIHIFFFMHFQAIQCEHFGCDCMTHLNPHFLLDPFACILGPANKALVMISRTIHFTQSLQTQWSRLRPNFTLWSAMDINGKDIVLL